MSKWEKEKGKNGIEVWRGDGNRPAAVKVGRRWAMPFKRGARNSELVHQGRYRGVGHYGSAIWRPDPSAIGQKAGRTEERIFNCVGEERVSVNELAVELNRIMGKKLSLIFADPRPGEV